MAKYRIVSPYMAAKVEGQPDERPLPADRKEWQALRAIGADIVEVRYNTEDELIGVTKDADALLIASAQVTRRVAEHLSRCRAVARYGIGVDTLDLDALTDHGIVAIYAPDFCVEEVANHAMMLLLACAKKLVLLHNMAAEGVWDRSLLSPMPTIWGQTLTLVGFGKLARAVARKAKAFQMQVVAYDPYADQASAWELGVDLMRMDFHQALARADFVSVHTPLNSETRHMFGEAEFQVMKRSAYFINTSRGPVVDETALIKALQQGWIAGAGLDVFEKEPPDRTNPLLKMANVVMTPHTASFSDVAFSRLYARIGEEVARVLTGKPPLCCANPRVKPRTASESGLK
jgi:D-3-phosphoglycerate dehydrogenase / 2-oxoglutarate reductase